LLFSLKFAVIWHTLNSMCGCSPSWPSEQSITSACNSQSIPRGFKWRQGGRQATTSLLLFALCFFATHHLRRDVACIYCSYEWPILRGCAIARGYCFSYSRQRVLVVRFVDRVYLKGLFLLVASLALTRRPAQEGNPDVDVSPSTNQTDTIIRLPNHWYSMTMFSSLVHRYILLDWVSLSSTITTRMLFGCRVRLSPRAAHHTHCNGYDDWFLWVNSHPV